MAGFLLPADGIFISLHGRHVGLKLSDERWSRLAGGYKVAYDARQAFAALSRNYRDSAAWEEILNELHHQGDVGEASYAAIPALVGISSQRRHAHWALYGLAATVEEARLVFPRNPPIPEWLERDYADAWQRLFEFALRDLGTESEPSVVTCALAVVALHRKQLSLGRLALCDDDERTEMLQRQFGAG
ncbi:hypothetical protein N7E70_006500 [Aminobacter sp. NyZ550]|uniref:hypothetical protein n=1 Tax=Aminobacter sp. NyZ550 TaxID=2979870 RepID=UPI0021D5778F|nr:hypothetical protein [Aminobacter sp. NyZ550]WAX96511.1 hypothetical protein N7E70_006500 [Aminobacter sp. NyZ550]